MLVPLIKDIISSFAEKKERKKENFIRTQFILEQ